MASSLGSAIPKQIVDDASNAAFVPPDWLLFSRREALMAVRFDARNLRVIGEPVTLPIGKVGYYPDRNLAYFATSPNGILVYLPPNRGLTQMRWVDRQGRVLGSEDQPAYFIGASLSPDGKRIAFTRTEDGSAERADIWIHDIGGTTSRFTFDGYCGTVRWSSDGKRLFFASSVKGVADLYSRPISGSGRTETVSVSRGYKETFDISPDGKSILTSEQVPGTGVDLMLVSLSDHQVTPFVRTPATDWMPAFSPDGRWVTYFSTGQICVRRFPDTGEQWQITTAGGFDPKWSRDGNAIFYTAPDGTVMSTAVRRGGTFNFDSPRPLFRCDVSAMPEGLSSPVVGISNDAQRFLVVTKTDSREIPFQIVLNWPEMVKGR
jgi:Tol biopolymer transport system component